MPRIFRICRSRRGSSAIEFALVAPVFLTLIAGVIAYGSIFATHNGVQQLAAEAARATIAGLNNTERDALARAHVTATVGYYPYLTAARLTVSTAAVGSPETGFRVDLTYDNANAFAYQFAGLLPLPASSVQRSAVIQRGGY